MLATKRPGPRRWSPVLPPHGTFAVPRPLDGIHRDGVFTVTRLVSTAALFTTLYAAVLLMKLS